jgi:phosphoribosyl-AMP cyclohydrolase
LKAYSFIQGQIMPEGSLKDLQQHWQAIEALVVALNQCRHDNAVLKEVLLSTEFLQSYFSLAAAALQQVAAGELCWTRGASTGNSSKPGRIHQLNYFGRLCSDGMPAKAR